MIDVSDLDFSEPSVALDSAIEFAQRWLVLDEPTGPAAPIPADTPEPLQRYWAALGDRTFNSRSVSGPVIAVVDPARVQRDRSVDHEMMVFAGYGGQGMTWGTPTGTDLVDPPMFENYDNTDGWEQVNDSLTRFLTAAIFMNFARLGHTGDLPATYWRSVHDDVQKQTPLAAFGVYTPQTSQAWIHSDNLLVTKENAFSDNATWVVGAPTPDTITELQSEHGRPSYTKISVSLGKHTGQALHTRWSVSFLPDGSAKLRLTGEGLELPPGSVDFSLLTERAEAARDERVSEGHADITVADPKVFLHVGPSAQGHPITEERAKALTELVLAKATRHPEFDEQWSTSRPTIYR